MRLVRDCSLARERELRGLEEADHYETLELPHDASFEEIEKAYRILRDAYAAESLALYSVFTEGDAVVMRERVENAYRILSDFALRRSYDEERGADTEQLPAARSRDELSAAGKELRSDLVPLGSTGALEAQADEPDGGEWDGAGLRRARLHAGLELEEIADITKVGIRTLRQIEEDAFEDLPATVYVRGFVTTYARTIGIDPGRVVTTYIERLEDSRRDQGRGRFLGRR